MADNVEGSLTAAMENEKKAMANMSKLLLKALWRERADKLNFAMAAGRQVVRP
jgi:hypothetical protein